MPPLKKKQREIMRKFQHEQVRVLVNYCGMDLVFPYVQAEIQRLQEASKQASQERKMLLKQQEDINKIRKSSQAYKDKLRQLLRGHQDVNLSSVSLVSALSSDSSDSQPATDSAKKDISETPVCVCCTFSSNNYRFVCRLKLLPHPLHHLFRKVPDSHQPLSTLLERLCLNNNTVVVAVVPTPSRLPHHS